MLEGRNQLATKIAQGYVTRFSSSVNSTVFYCHSCDVALWPSRLQLGISQSNTYEDLFVYTDLKGLRMILSAGDSEELYRILSSKPYPTLRLEPSSIPASAFVGRLPGAKANLLRSCGHDPNRSSHLKTTPVDYSVSIRVPCEWLSKPPMNNPLFPINPDASLCKDALIRQISIAEIFAACSSPLELNSVVILGVDLDRSDDKYSRPIHRAAQSGNLECLKICLEAGADINARNGMGRTALTIACSFNFVECAEFLINQGSDVNLQDWAGETPLIAACKRGWIGVTKLLLDNGVDVGFRDTTGDTAEDCAIKGGLSEVLKLLRRGISS